MKTIKNKILIIVSLLLLLSGCGGRHSTAPEISPLLSAKYIDKSLIMSFSFNEKTSSYIAEYETNCVDYSASFTYGRGSEDNTVKSDMWDDEKWDKFIDAIYKCGVLEWHHMDRKEGEPGDWSIVFTGDFGIATISGSGSYPKKWQEFKDILADYFGEIE